MIVRDLIKNPDYVDTFDHFNDHRDTLRYLRGLPPSAERDAVIERLRQAAIDKGLDPERGR